MSTPIQKLIEEIKRINPRWAISEPASSDGSDGVVGRLNHGKIDVWDFDEPSKEDVQLTMEYICTACREFPKMYAALDIIKDGNTDPDRMVEIANEAFPK